ncbi:hypothetical protein D9756_007612 [Leucocoprinus leucothites]|uniref:Uncharacterized protein n=1 Tax=Leucocoprinus leucothites TaxID=201217 RepID=A0A8H5FWR0_9AGAR|nr:hypothetical protein D9756_007612 [Leucoagaricus leucothites]
MVNTQSSPGGQSSPSEPDTSSRTGQEASQIPQDVSAELNLSSEPEIPMRLHLEAWVKRWQFHDALTRWAVWALNVPNQPPGYLHNNIFVTELTLNKNPSHSEDMFTCGPVPVVQDRNELARCFYNHKISKDEINWCAHGRWDNDKVQVCVIYDSIVAHHEGTYHRGAPELNPDGRLIHLVPKLYNAFCETLSMFYRPHLWSAIQMNDRMHFTATWILSL